MRTRLQRLAAAVIVVTAIVAAAHTADAKPSHSTKGHNSVTTNTIDSGGRSFG